MGGSVDSGSKFSTTIFRFIDIMRRTGGLCGLSSWSDVARGFFGDGGLLGGRPGGASFSGMLSIFT